MRHSNMLARAHFLSTKTEPKLVCATNPIYYMLSANMPQYYKPWEPLPEEVDRIKQQISEVEALIKRELDEFDKSHPEEPSKEAPTLEEEKIDTSSKETVGEPHTESPPISNVDVEPVKPIEPTNPHVQTPQPDQSATGEHSSGEHNGEVLVEAEEDTVIY